MSTEDYDYTGLCLHGNVSVSPKRQIKHDNQTQTLWSKGSYDHLGNEKRKKKKDEMKNRNPWSRVQ